MKPTLAMAMTAATVATVPIKVPCIQVSAPVMAPEPAGSMVWACAAVAMTSEAAVVKNTGTGRRMDVSLMIARSCWGLAKHRLDIGRGLGKGRNAAMAIDGAGSGVVRRERQAKVAIVTVH